MLLTSEALRTIMPMVVRDQVEVLAAALSAAMTRGEVETVLRAGAFLANIAWETGDLRYAEEIASGQAYEGRIDLGNVQAGWGRRYKGRGWFMLTGRAAYELCEQELKIPLTEHPEYAARPEYAADIAVWFWRRGAGLRLSSLAKARLGAGINLNAVADRGDLEGVTMAINGRATLGTPSHHRERLGIFLRAVPALMRLGFDPT